MELMNNDKISIIHPENDELLGFVVEASDNNWEAQTTFGYVIARTFSQALAEQAVRNSASEFRRGVWQYYDKDDDNWHTCIIKHASPNSVTVVRTNSMGFQEQGDYKLVVLHSPYETSLIKN